MRKLLGVVFLLLLVPQFQAGSVNLLVSKTILNEHVVEDKELTVRYSIYNIGTSPAQNVFLDDSTFPEEDFTLVQGLLSTSWDRIAQNNNISHVVILRPKVAGFFNVSWARVSYSSADDSSEQVGYSSAPGVVKVNSYAEFARTHEDHVVEWLAFVAMSAPTILLPFLMWYRSYAKYEGIKSKKAA